MIYKEILLQVWGQGTELWDPGDGQHFNQMMASREGKERQVDKREECLAEERENRNPRGWKCLACSETVNKVLRDSNMALVCGLHLQHPGQ